MKSKKSLKLKIIIPAIVIVVLAAGGALAYSLTPRPVFAEKNQNTAVFNFDASKAPGWFAGNNIDGSAINADAAPTSVKLATTTRIIAQGTADKPSGDCFVQYSYWANNSKDPAQVIKDLSAPSDPSTPGSFTPEPVSTVRLNMNAASNNTSFQLHQYNITGADAKQMSDGEEFGAFKAGSGYIDIRGYCKTANELSVTLPVFSAVSFNN